jgi:hypothetical protein
MWRSLMNIVDNPRLSLASMVEPISDARTGLIPSSRAPRRPRGRCRACETSHLQHPPADSPSLLGGQPHLG